MIHDILVGFMGSLIYHLISMYSLFLWRPASMLGVIAPVVMNSLAVFVSYLRHSRITTILACIYQTNKCCEYFLPDPAELLNPCQAPIQFYGILSS